MRYASGEFYHGEHKADRREGVGTYHHASGAVVCGHFRAGHLVGEGVRWGAEPGQAWRLQNGETQAVLAVDIARALTARIMKGAALKGAAHGAEFSGVGK